MRISILAWAAVVLLSIPMGVAHAQDEETACAPGTRIEIDYYGSWMPGVIKGGADAEGECLVSYDGYSEAWDARLPLTRIRRAGRTQPLARMAPVAARLWLGNYVCTRAGGSISPAFGFTIHPDRQVTDHEGGNPGSYRIDTENRTIAFTGGGWNGRTGRFGLAESVFTYYEGDREVVTCRPINGTRP